MRFIDTHLHLIWRNRFGYGWTAGIPPLATGDFLPEQAHALAGERIAGRIFMEASVDDADYQAEARFVAGLVADGTLLGQIASCRPESDDGFADWIAECAGLGVVGFRRILHVMPDETSLSEVFRANIRRLGAAGYPFDICMLPRQLPLALMLGRACPETIFVLDHCGVPDIAGGGLDPWRADIAALAALPNMHVKLSGLTAYAGGDRGLEPFVQHVFATFGPQRIVWGSDWPVVNLGSGLPDWLTISERLLSGLHATDQAAIAAENARRIWRLPGA